MRSLIVSLLLLSVLLTSAQETSLDKVKELNPSILNKKIEVYYSAGYKVRAKEVLSLLKGAKKFYEKKLDVKVPFRVAVLNKEDW